MGFLENGYAVLKWQARIINISRPTKVSYTKCSKQKLPNDIKIENIVNIKYLHTGINELMYPYKIICDKIIKEMIDIDDLKFLKFRDLLYDIFIYVIISRINKKNFYRRVLY